MIDKKSRSSVVKDILQEQIDLYIEAMHIATSRYGSSLSHKEFMDKTEEIFCELQQDECKPFSEKKEEIN